MVPWLMNAVNVCHNWLLSVADFHATERGLDQLARKILFNLIFKLPTVSDVVVDVWEDVDEKAMQREGRGKYVMKECGGCSGIDRQEGYWVRCGQCKSNHHPGCLSKPRKHYWVKDCPLCVQSSSSAKKKPSKSAKKRKNRN